MLTKMQMTAVFLVLVVNAVVETQDWKVQLVHESGYCFVYTERAICFDYIDWFERTARTHAFILSFVSDSHWLL